MQFCSTVAGVDLSASDDELPLPGTPFPESQHQRNDHDGQDWPGQNEEQGPPLPGRPQYPGQGGREERGEHPRIAPVHGLGFQTVLLAETSHHPLDTRMEGEDGKDGAADESNGDYQNNHRIGAFTTK
jgi:hypothetical protein